MRRSLSPSLYPSSVEEVDAASSPVRMIRMPPSSEHWGGLYCVSPRRRLSRLAVRPGLRRESRRGASMASSRWPEGRQYGSDLRKSRPLLLLSFPYAMHT